MTSQEKRAEYKKRWYEENALRLAERRKQYYQENKERQNLLHREYVKANKEKVTEYQKKYRNENRDAFRSYNKKYQKSDRVRALKRANTAIRRGRIRKYTPNFLLDSDAEREAIKNIYRLASVFEAITGVKHHVDHMWPISKGGPHWSGNLQIITADENQIKFNKSDHSIVAVIKDGIEWTEENYDKL